VTAFVETLTHRIYDTDAAKALQTRLLKNRSRLFTFTHRDGVSWSNNLAENAIKQFGYYRDDVGRSVKETGLSEYLVLLSLYQTCRVRGLSFSNSFSRANATSTCFSTANARAAAPEHWKCILKAIYLLLSCRCAAAAERCQRALRSIRWSRFDRLKILCASESMSADKDWHDDQALL